MDTFAYIISVVLVAGYAGASIWFVVCRERIWQVVAAGVGSLLLGAVLVSYLHIISTVIAWIIVIALILLILKVFLD